MEKPWISREAPSILTVDWDIGTYMYMSLPKNQHTKHAGNLTHTLPRRSVCMYACIDIPMKSVIPSS